MPCESSYMNPTRAEVNSREMAANLIYLKSALGLDIDAAVRRTANDYYGSPALLNDFVVELCSILSTLTPEQMDSIVYDGKNPQARKLADFWDEHQKADRERELRQKETAEKAKLQQAAKAKLTEKEREVLGL